LKNVPWIKRASTKEERHAILTVDNTDWGQFSLMETHEPQTPESRMRRLFVMKLLKIIMKLVTQYQQYKEEDRAIRILLKTNIDNLMMDLYKEYKLYAEETKPKGKRKYGQPYSSEHHLDMDRLWALQQVEEHHLEDRDFGHDEIYMMQNWDRGWASNTSSPFTIVPLVMDSSYYTEEHKPMDSIIEAYNYHMTQYIGWFLLSSKYHYPHEALEVPTRYHIAKIKDYHGLAEQALNDESEIQKPKMARTASASSSYPIRNILWRDVPLAEMKSAPLKPKSESNTSYPMLVKTINKPEFIPSEYAYIQQDGHHHQSLLQCLTMAIRGKEQKTGTNTATFTEQQYLLRGMLAGFATENTDIFQLCYNDEPLEMFIFDILQEIIANYKRYLGVWPSFLESSPDYKDRDTWLGWYFLDQFANRATQNNAYDYGWCTNSMFRHATEFYIHIIMKRENINASTPNDFAFDEVGLAYICAHMFDIGIHIWKQHQVKSKITYKHYDFIHRNAHQGARNFFPTINILYVEQEQTLGVKHVYTCPQYRLLLHKGHIFEDIDPSNYSLTRATVRRWVKPPILPYGLWSTRKTSIIDLYNCIVEEFHGNDVGLQRFTIKCLKHFCKLEKTTMDYFQAYEGCWKLVHALQEHFPLIGLYSMFAIPDPDPTSS
jgi:hypothetical protein